MASVNANSFTGVQPVSLEGNVCARSALLNELDVRMRALRARMALLGLPGARTNCPEHLYGVDGQELAAARKLDD